MLTLPSAALEGQLVGPGLSVAQRDPILIVEDERAQREALAQYLARQGYAVSSAASGEEALGLLERSSHAVLITDLRLPGLDGLGGCSIAPTSSTRRSRCS